MLEMKVPSPGESISEVEITQWLVSDGEYVEKDQAIAEVDSDKATLELPAEAAGIIKILVEPGIVAVGDVVAHIDTSAPKPEGAPKAAQPAAVVEAPKAEAIAAPAPAPAPATTSYASGHPSPAAAKMMADNGVPSGAVKGTGKDGRVTKSDVVAAMSAGFDTCGSSWLGRQPRHQPPTHEHAAQKSGAAPGIGEKRNRHAYHLQ
jgi:2-oxoglutarate dehydrogenase E2 component (dihydrolipoamide succinyltransferase)